jgi:Flp pilus assembly pilin Flp
MRNAGRIIARFLSGDAGGEVLEYSIVAGMISLAALALIASFASRVAAEWAPLGATAFE